MNSENSRSPILTVEGIYRPDVVCCRPEDSVAGALHLMAQQRIGSVVITDAQQRPAGILTRRDAMRLQREHLDGATPLSEVMSRPVKTVTVDSCVDELGIMMMRNRFRHAVVVDAQGCLLGIVSESDIVNSHGLEHDLFLRALIDICNTDPLRLPGECTLAVAMERIRTAGHTAALVLGEPLRIITESDIIRLLDLDAAHMDQPLSQLDLRELFSVPGNISLYNVRRYFHQQGYRHLGVLDEREQVVGIVSFTDILRSVELDYIYRLRELLDDHTHHLHRVGRHLRIVEKVIDASMEGIVICDEQGLIQSVNPAFTQITGYEEWEVLGCNPSILSSGRHDAAFYSQMWETLERDGRWQGEIWNKNKSGRVYPEWLSITAIEDEQGRVIQYAAIFHDLTELKRSEARINKMAYFDEITHLANRRLFHDRLEHALAYAADHGHQVTLISLDLDWFKRINDRFGQVEGDRLLRELASRMESLLGDADTAARPGGDEFNLILTTLDSTEELPLFLDRLCKVLSAPVLVEDTEVRVTSSIGVAIFPDDARDAEGLLRCADTALKQAKDLGRNSYHFYSPALHQQTQSRFHLANLLQNALANQELRLYYQPKQCLNSGEIPGVEALVRWFSPELGLVSPAEFIPLAEDMGVIDQIGDWVLEEAARQSQQWAEQGLRINVAVNVSARQFQRGDVAHKVLALMHQHGLDAHQLSIELTETSFMHSADKTRAALEQLCEHGISVAIDDFGTGYSSLNYIRSMALSQLKIDLSFIKTMSESRRDQKLVQVMIDMAHAMDFEVIAEGVETPEQLDRLRKMGCDMAQGYLIARPMPAEQLSHWLAQRRRQLAEGA